MVILAIGETGFPMREVRLDPELHRRLLALAPADEFPALDRLRDPAAEAVFDPVDLEELTGELRALRELCDADVPLSQLADELLEAAECAREAERPLEARTS